MTGAQIRRLRRALGLEAIAFAKVLGVHPSTLYRWEQSSGQVRMDPLQGEILAKLDERLRKIPREEKKAVGDHVLKALLAGGMLMGLAALVAKILDEEE